jgi:6-phospho-beta-glucosidase
MKIAIIGAAGIRTPLILEAMLRRQDRLRLRELALMDINGPRLEIIASLTAPLEQGGNMHFKLTRTTEARVALAGADYVITTFRVGGILSRVIDERVPLDMGVLGQETTGPGGFAMGLRTIPVLLDYLQLMQEVCPQAWLINFANPAGMLAEAAVTAGGWRRTVGICDAPSGMLRAAAALADARPEEVYLDYFGLNHLGWVRRVLVRGEDYLPGFIDLFRQMGGMPGLPFDLELIASLGLIPNEYLYYFYHNHQAVDNILQAGQSRGEQIAALNETLFNDLAALLQKDDLDAMHDRYLAYLGERGATYMSRETGHSHTLDEKLSQIMKGEGYAGVALDVIEGLSGIRPCQMILNVPNHGAITGMGHQDVVEIPAFVMPGGIHPLTVGEIPPACLGLMKQVKAYEQLTIQAAVENSYTKAFLALSQHPLVPGRDLARSILDGYIEKHGDCFPQLV